MAANPVRLERQCPRDQGDLVYDVGERAYQCQTCDYKRATLQAEPHELVVAQAPIPIEEVASRWGVKIQSARWFLGRHEIPTVKVGGVVCLTADQFARASRIRENAHKRITAEDHPPARSSG